MLRFKSRCNMEVTSTIYISPNAKKLGSRFYVLFGKSKCVLMRNCASFSSYDVNQRVLQRKSKIILNNEKK